MQYFYYSLIALISAAICVIDVRKRIIPNILLFAYISIAFVFHYLEAESISMNSHLLGLLCGLGLFVAGDLISGGRKVGAGDIKLAGTIGFITGFPAVLPVLLAGALSVTLICGVMIYIGKMRRGTPVPYAPFIISGLLLTSILGKTISGFITI